MTTPSRMQLDAFFYLLLHAGKQLICYGSLQPLRVRPRPTQPCFELRNFRQDDRHRLGVNRRDDSVRLASQKRKQVICRFAVLQLPDTAPCRNPDPCEKRRLVGCHLEPGIACTLARPRFGEPFERDQASVLWSKPPPPVRRACVAHVGDASVDPRLAVKLGWRRQPPARASQDVSIALERDDRSRAVRIDVAGLHVASMVIQVLEYLAHRFHGSRVVIEIAHHGPSQSWHAPNAVGCNSTPPFISFLTLWLFCTPCILAHKHFHFRADFSTACSTLLSFVLLDTRSECILSAAAPLQQLVDEKQISADDGDHKAPQWAESRM